MCYSPYIGTHNTVIIYVNFGELGRNNYAESDEGPIGSMLLKSLSCFKVIKEISADNDLYFWGCVEMW